MVEENDFYADLVKASKKAGFKGRAIGHRRLACVGWVWSKANADTIRELASRFSKAYEDLEIEIYHAYQGKPIRFSWYKNGKVLRETEDQQEILGLLDKR